MLGKLLSKRPIIQAPMAGVQGAELTIAVCEAGGIGSLPGAMLGSDALKVALDRIVAETVHPFNVNFFCHQPPAADPTAQNRWREKLAPYYAELSADGNAPAGPPRLPFSAEALSVLEPHKPSIVSFHFGLPRAELLQNVKAMGTLVLGCATSVAEAEWLQAHGADGVIAQGIDAGGHQGCFLPHSALTPLKCLDLVRAIAQVVTVPVIAAGGIANRIDAEAALVAGAAAVQVGSAYLLADEATTSAVHRAALQSDAAKKTALTNVFSGGRARGIVNRLMRELGPIADQLPEFPDAAEAIAPLRSAAEANSSGDFSPLWSGERGYLGRSLPAAQITRDICPRKERTIRG